MKKLSFIILLLMSFSSYSACRSESVKHKFDVTNGFPHGRTGYVVDHICALELGGLDTVTNMQYQTIADGKVKDKVERTPYGKKKWCNTSNSLPTRTVYNCKK
jgi:hypothetical protein